MKPSRALVASWALLLVALCLSTHLPVAAGKPGSKGTKAKGTGKSQCSVSVVVETVSSIKKGQGPPAPANARKDADDTDTPKPAHLDQENIDDTAVAVSGSGQSANPAVTGRKLLALGDPCTVIVKNACRSKKSFLAAFGYYTPNGVDDGIPGWEAQGWYRIPYGKTTRFTGSQTLYVLTLNGLKPTRTFGKPAAFCVSRRPFWILMGDDDSFYKYDDRTGRYNTYGTCKGAGGYYSSGFWAPRRCGTTIIYQNC